MVDIIDRELENINQSPRYGVPSKMPNLGHSRQANLVVMLLSFNRDLEEQVKGFSDVDDLTSEINKQQDLFKKEVITFAPEFMPCSSEEQ